MNASLPSRPAEPSETFGEIQRGRAPPEGSEPRKRVRDGKQRLRSQMSEMTVVGSGASTTIRASDRADPALSYFQVRLGFGGRIARERCRKGCAWTVENLVRRTTRLESRHRVGRAQMDPRAGKRCEKRLS
jgi:hypothetical protein